MLAVTRTEGVYSRVAYYTSSMYIIVHVYNIHVHVQCTCTCITAALECHVAYMYIALTTITQFANPAIYMYIPSSGHTGKTNNAATNIYLRENTGNVIMM